MVQKSWPAIGGSFVQYSVDADVNAGKLTVQRTNTVSGKVDSVDISMGETVKAALRAGTDTVRVFRQTSAWWTGERSDARNMVFTLNTPGR